MAHKFKILMSDLHLGAGRQKQGNALEDFSNGQQVADLLDQVIAESEREGVDVELIFDGDVFEMLQIPRAETFEPRFEYMPHDYHSMSEPDSIIKVAHAIDGHPKFFGAVSRFISPGPPRRSIAFVKGNHDINLYWPGVQARLREAIGAIGERSSLLVFEPRFISREGMYVEHGNQYATFVDRVDDMEEPLDPERPGQLKPPPGSWFVMNVFNRLERQRYWIDGIKPITRLVWYALAYDFEFAVWAIAQLIRALPGTIEAATFDAPDSRVDLARQLEDSEEVHILEARYQTDPEFRAQFNARVARAISPPAPFAAPADAMPAALVFDPVAMGDKIAEQVRSSLFAAAARCAEEHDARVVVFGHTHEPGTETLPNGAVYINCGTWTWTGDFTAAGAETWRELFEHPERFTRRRHLTYVRVDYDDAGEPSGRLITIGDEPVKPGPGSASLAWWLRPIAWLAKFWYQLLGKLGRRS